MWNVQRAISVLFPITQKVGAPQPGAFTLCMTQC